MCFRDARGRPIVSASVHRELQAFLSAHRRALVELPRDHGKSTQIGIRLVWELGRQPGLRIKIVCASEAMAVERGRFVRDAIAGNSRVRMVFPWLRPATPWEAIRFSVARPASVIGPSVAALGVDARSTGARADLIVCDDIVDVSALASAAHRERVKQMFRENLMNLLEPDGRLWYVFTPWHRGDLGAELTADGGFAHFRRAIGPDLTPIWPGHWPRERLIERRREIGEAAFARGYRLICTADDATAIRPAWIRTWTTLPPLTRTVMAIDPAASESARADRSAVVVVGESTEGKALILAATARRVSSPQLIEWLTQLDELWRPDVVLFEGHGGFAAVCDLIRRHAPFGRKVQSITHRDSKAGRLAALGVSLENGRCLLRGADGTVDPTQQELFDELIAFPTGEHDDLADAAAFGVHWLLRRPEPKSWIVGSSL